MRVLLRNNFFPPSLIGLAVCALVVLMSYNDEAYVLVEMSGTFPILKENQDDAECHCTDVQNPLTKVLKLTSLVAKQGDTHSQWALGKMYYDGEGVPNSLEDSIKRFRRAAEQGHAESQFQLALIISAKCKTPATKQLANFWMQCAADHGHSKATEILEEYPGSQNEPERLKDT